MKIKNILALMTLLLFAGFCSTHKDIVRKRAKFDLNCEQIEVQVIGGTSYGARGCDKRATYNCTGPVMGSENQITCIKEESRND